MLLAINNYILRYIYIYIYRYLSRKRPNPNIKTMPACNINCLLT